MGHRIGMACLLLTGQFEVMRVDKPRNGPDD